MNCYGSEFESVSEMSALPYSAYNTILDYRFAEKLDNSMHSLPFCLFRVAVVEYDDENPACVVFEEWQYRVDYYFLMDRITLSLEEFLNFRECIKGNCYDCCYAVSSTSALLIDENNSERLTFDFSDQERVVSITRGLMTMKIDYGLLTHISDISHDRYLPATVEDVDPDFLTLDIDEQSL